MGGGLRSREVGDAGFLTGIDNPRLIGSSDTVKKGGSPYHTFVTDLICPDIFRSKERSFPLL